MLQESRHDDVTVYRMARTLLGRGRYFTTAYRVDGLMVDTGARHTLPEMLEALAGHPVHTVVNTHTHEDHVAGNGPLQERYGCRILAHPLALPVLRDPRLRGPLHPYRQVMWGPTSPCRPEAAGRVVETPRYRFRVLHTPGHSPDHISLFEEERGWLFSGDLFVGGEDRAARPDANGPDLIRSHECIRALQPTRVFLGSGNVRQGPDEELARKIDYLRGLEERVRGLRGEGLEVGEIRNRLFPKRMLIEWLTLGDFSAENLVRAFLKAGTEVDRDYSN
jgi:glyoxylase-like metal-dependent hydrolase (beta-lactamase superfamily II)